MTSIAGMRSALVVERAGAARDLAVHFLRESGWIVECAADGASAWERAQELQPALVVTEILIPKLDGLALCRRLKSSEASWDTRVVVVSMLAASARARDAGADGFLLKPISEARLLGEIEQLFPGAVMNREEHA